MEEPQLQQGVATIDSESKEKLDFKDKALLSFYLKTGDFEQIKEHISDNPYKADNIRLHIEKLEPHFFQQVCHNTDRSVVDILKVYKDFGINFNPKRLLSNNFYRVEELKFQLNDNHPQAINAFELTECFIGCVKKQDLKVQKNIFDMILCHEGITSPGVIPTIAIELSKNQFELEPMAIFTIFRFANDMPDLATHVLNNSVLPRLTDEQISDSAENSWYVKNWAQQNKYNISPDAIYKLAQRMIKTRRYEEFEVLLQEGLDVDQDRCKFLSNAIKNGHFQLINKILPYTKMLDKAEVLIWNMPNQFEKGNLLNDPQYLEIVQTVETLLEKQKLENLFSPESRVETPNNKTNFKI